MASIRIPAQGRYPVVRSVSAGCAAALLCVAVVWPLAAGAQAAPWRPLSN